MKCPLGRRVGKARRCGEHRGADTSRGNGADDEDSRSDIEGNGRKAEMVGGGRDNRGDGPDDAAVAGAVPGTRLQRAVGSPQAESESEADRGGSAGTGVAAVPGEVFRFQRTAFSRKAGRGARDKAKLHVGEDGAAGGGAGGAEKEARVASEASAEAAVAWHDAAHRCERARLVSG